MKYRGIHSTESKIFLFWTSTHVAHAKRRHWPSRLELSATLRSLSTDKHELGRRSTDRHHHLRSTHRVTASVSTGFGAGGAQLDTSAEEVNRVVGTACVAMLLAAAHRVSFSVLAVPIQQHFALSLPEMGLLQSSLLVGYVLGQIPLGIVADRVGGARLLAACLFVWSFANTLFSRAPLLQNPMPYMLAARAALGLGQSCIMPAVSSLSAAWFPAAQRSLYTSTIYAFFSVGTVAGLALTPVLAGQVGWPACFLYLGLAGMVCSCFSLLTLPSEKGRSSSRRFPAHQAAAQAAAQQQQHGLQQGWTPSTAAHLGMLCFVHSIISWSFFILQSWIPTFVHSLGTHSLEAVGLLSALPWLATAVSSVLAGRFADWLQTSKGMSSLSTRRLMQSISILGALASLVPLALTPASSMPAEVAVGLLTVAVAAQGFNYGGFHSYVQDVAPANAGLVLGITNTCGTLVGIAGNMATGYLAGSALGYQAVFGLTVILHALSFTWWFAGAHGEHIILFNPKPKSVHG